MKKWEVSIHILLAMGLVGAYADVPTGIIGGTDGSDAYSALIFPGEVLFPVSGMPPGQINGVAMNALGIGLIGGQDDTGGYAAFISPDGTVNALSLDLLMGTVSAASVNQSGVGLIGGNDDVDSSQHMYAALVLQSGAVTPLLSMPVYGFIHSTALNDDGLGLIGGEGGTLPYAAYVTAGGSVNQLDTAPLAGGRLAVAINDLGNGIIGGIHTLGAYAAFVTPDSDTPVQLSPLPSGSTANIISVAINHSGVGLIGGNDDSSQMYAGYSSPAGDVAPLFETPDPGQILSVAINASGVGLIGGYINSDLYAALVQSDQTVQPLMLGSMGGSIYSVALNDAGVGLIGGQLGSNAYAALMAPDGTLTPFDIAAQSIFSVALRGEPIIEAATPQSVGPYLSGLYTQLAASSALQSRFVEKNRLWSRKNSSQAHIAQAELACNEVVFNRTSPIAKKPSQPQERNTIWMAPFGNYTRLKGQDSIPSYSNEIGGALLAYDHQGSHYLAGASVGYAFNYIDYSQGIGHSKLQEEMVSLYTAYYHNHFWFDVALWGGLYQLSTVRHTLSMITSKGSTHGWILSPHLEIAASWAMDREKLYFIEPFFMLDWVNSWQNHYTETGAAGFNLHIGNLYSSLLQSEAGLRFYEQFEYGWGDIRLEEKLSYVNQAPFGSHSATTSFVSSASSFPIAVGSSQVENLGSVQLIASFVPNNSSYPFGGFAIQATANESYQSYFASIFGGMDF